MNSNYYDEPEGKDAFGKMVATNKYAAAVGLGWGTFDVLLISHTQGYLPTLSRYAIVTAPFIACASAFTMGTYAACNLRNKDDKRNYAIGGYCAGAALGAIKRNVVTGLVMGSFFAIAGCVKKMSKEEGWEFFPKQPYHGYGSLNSVNHDYTLMAERPRNWAIAKDTSAKVSESCGCK